MPTRRILYRRKFLNRPRHHSGAHTISDIQVRSSRSGDHIVDATLHLADCRRSITLDFDIISSSDARNALHKARLLRDIVTEYADGIERAVAEWEDRRGNSA